MLRIITICPIFISFFVIFSCSHKIIVLPEVSAEKIPSAEEEKIPSVTGIITEIEEVKGEQKYIYIKVGSNNKRIKNDLYGYIYNDVAQKEKIGKFQLIQVYKNFSKGKIINLSYTIDAKAIALIEVDPRFLIKK